MKTKLEIFVDRLALFKTEMATLEMPMDLFGQVEGVDPVDIVQGIVTVFYGITEDDDYETAIRSLAYVKGVKIDEDAFKRAKPLIINFIKFVQAL